jgi:predicted amidophosphoribosyltransferase
MARICTQCHAELSADANADWCPACGGAIIEHEDSIAKLQPAIPKAEVDHRGILLPRGHASGGIITPQ